MKNIFKKNHIIITALAIMIVIAGYLSFTNNDTASEKDDMMVTDSGDYEEFTQTDNEDALAENTQDTTETASTEDILTAETEDNGEVAEATESDAASAKSEDGEKLAATDEDTQAKTEDGQKTAESSDKDLTASVQQVTDNGELDLEEGVPGEAVLANAAIDSSYFISSKLEREQVRAKNKETYMDIMESPEVSEKQKQEAIDAMFQLTDIAEKENAAEMLLEAKGFDGAVVFMNDGKVEVVVNAEALTDQQLAIIEDVVKEKTGIAAKNIGISSVVVAE